MSLLNLVLMLTLILLYTFQSFFSATYSKNYPGKSNLSSLIFSIVSGAIVVIVTFAFSGLSFSASPFTVLFGIIVGLVLVLYNTSLIKASKSGSYSIVMVFSIAGGTICPVISTAIMGERHSPMKLICIAIVLISVYMISRKKGTVEKPKKHFFLYCFLLALANGSYISLLDLQQRITGESEKDEMAIIAYSLCTVISAIILIAKEKKNSLRAFKQTKTSLIFILLSSIVTALALNLFVTLINLMNDSTLLFTIENSGVYLASVLFSVIFFKEKLSLLNVIGCLTLCIVLVGITFF